jgi:cation:H+ antiporter
MVMQLLLLLLGFVLLILGASWLVNGASSLAKRFKVPELIIGLTIVAFGTSAPELVVNIVGSTDGLGDVVLGNVIGSNIFNLLLILGISGSILPIVVQSQTVWREIPISLLIVFLLLFLANDPFSKEGVVGLGDGIVLLAFFAGFIIYVIANLKKGVNAPADSIKLQPLPLSLFLLLAGLAGLIFGGRLVVNKAVEIARFYSLSEKLIGLTIISIGTSLPELATSVVAAMKKKSDLAIGNVIGSNIFNLSFILGVCALINPIDYNPVFNSDLGVLGIATLLLFIAMFTGKKKKLDRWEAVLLVLGFVVYMVYILLRN